MSSKTVRRPQVNKAARKVRKERQQFAKALRSLHDPTAQVAAYRIETALRNGSMGSRRTEG